jgi:hypothetical protein
MATVGYDLVRSPDGAIDRFNCHPKRHKSEHMMGCVNSRDSLVGSDRDVL